MARLDALARFSADADGLTRLYLTPAHAEAAAKWPPGWRRPAWTPGSTPHARRRPLRGRDARAPTLLLGSHIDTVRNAGRYDGNLAS